MRFDDVDLRQNLEFVDEFINSHVCVKIYLKCLKYVVV
jgi:hypothetical protein